MILRYSAPINGVLLRLYNWQNISKHVYSLGPVTGYVTLKSKCFKTVDMS